MSSNAKPELLDMDWLDVPLQVAHVDDSGRELAPKGSHAFPVAVRTTAKVVPPDYVVVGGSAPTDTTPESLEEPVYTPWHAVDGLDGMELVVRRVKRNARDVHAGVRFGGPVAQALTDEDGGYSVLVVLRIFVPDGVDRFVFRDELFTGLADELRPEDAQRLAVRVLALR